MARLKNIEQAIYVMVAPTGECKIGIAENPRARWNNLKYCTPRGEVRLVFQSHKSPDMWRVERHMHTKLASRRLNGEWFDIEEAAAVAAVKEALEIAVANLAEPKRRTVSKNPRKMVLAPGKPPRKPRRRNVTRNAEIIARLKTGETGMAIAPEYKISPQAISLIAIKAGLIRHRGRPASRALA
jgi:hypothetical protein